MKKVYALLLALVMALSAVSALAEYEDHIDFTATYVERGSTEIDDMYRFFCDQFNVDIEMIGIPWSAMADTNSVMVMGGTMYDWMMITFDINVYASYVDQGLIKPLPENFRETYPNIARALDASGVGDYLSVDGLCYGIPMPILFNFAPHSFYLNMQAMFYRADWARELGFEDWGAAVSLSEFQKFLKACVEADKVGNGQTIGVTGPNFVSGYINQFCDSHGGFAKVDDKYVWGPTMDGVTEGIKYLKQAYLDGLLDPDFYALDSFAGQNKLAAGLSAAAYQTGTAANYQIILDAAAAAGMSNPAENIKPVMLTDEEGVWHGGEAKNYWLINVFRPDLDEKTFERILCLLDYLYTQEAEEVINMGIKGTDWDVDENGYYVSKLPADYANIRQKYPSGWFWRDTAICLDEFDLVNPTYSKAVLDSINAVYDYRYASAAEHGYTKLDNNVLFLSTEAMENYSVDISAEITRIVCDGSIAVDQVEAEWQKFIDANAPIWQPVVDDLNK